MQFVTSPPLRLLPAGASSCRAGFAPAGTQRLSARGEARPAGGTLLPAASHEAGASVPTVTTFPLVIEPGVRVSRTRLSDEIMPSPTRLSHVAPSGVSERFWSY